VVRKKSGFNRDDFKTKENYARVRENSSEFGHCSKTGKMLRNAIYPYYKKCGDRYLYQKFAKLMTAIKDFDRVSERGKRTVYQGLKPQKGKGCFLHLSLERFLRRRILLKKQVMMRGFL